MPKENATLKSGLCVYPFLGLIMEDSPDVVAFHVTHLNWKSWPIVRNILKREIQFMLYGFSRKHGIKLQI